MSGLILQQIFLAMNSDISSPLRFVYIAVHIVSLHPIDKESSKMFCHVDVKQEYIILPWKRKHCGRVLKGFLLSSGIWLFLTAGFVSAKVGAIW